MLLHIISGHDTFIDLPTGFRKRLIFDLASLCFDSHRGIALGSSKVLIVLPLIMLMESFRQHIQLPVTVLAQHMILLLRYLVTFCYTGTEEHNKACRIVRHLNAKQT